jgi:hypothetical protein
MTTGTWRWRGAVAALAVASFLAAVVTSRELFPLYSLNRDDSVYVAMSRMVEDGRLTLPAEEHELFRPWASGTRDGRIVVKYTPPWPTALAVGDLVLGSRRFVLGLTAAVASTLMTLLASEALRSRSKGLLAGVLFAASPIVIIQSGTFLPYLFQLNLGLGFALLLLTGVRKASAPRLVAAGAVLGIAGFARSFDAALFALPFLPLLVRAGRRPLLLVAAGVGPVLAVMAAYNAAVMGSPLRLPYTVTGPSDAFGFGRRGVFEALTIDFTPADGVDGTLRTLWHLLWWIAGGPLLVAAAVVGWRRARRGVPRPVVAIAATVVAGYLCFWAPHAMTEHWPGARTLGSFYHLPLLVPLCILAAAAVFTLGPKQRVVAAAAAVAVTAATLPGHVSANVDVRNDYRATAAAVERAVTEEPALLLIHRRGNLGFVSGTPFLENGPDLDQPVLYAEDRGPEVLPLLDRYPGRRVYRLNQDSLGLTATGGRVVVTETERRRGSDITLTVRLTNPSDAPIVETYVTDGRSVQRRVLDRSSSRGRSYEATWTITPSRRRGIVAVGMSLRQREGSRGTRYERRVPFRRLDDAGYDFLEPGIGYNRRAATGAQWREWVVDGVVDHVPS